MLVSVIVMCLTSAVFVGCDSKPTVMSVIPSKNSTPAVVGGSYRASVKPTGNKHDDDVAYAMRDKQEWTVTASDSKSTSYRAKGTSGSVTTRDTASFNDMFDLVK